MKRLSGIIVHPDEFTKKRIDSCVDLNISTLGIHPPGGKNAKDSLTALLNKLKTKEFRMLIDYAIAKGLRIEYEMHAASFLLDRSLFDTHPDYFRQDENYKRTPTGNLCVSNEEALEMVSNSAMNLALALYGSTENFYFWPDDIRGLKCNCEKCKNLSASDQQLIFQNAVLRGIRRAYPDAKVAYLAYIDCMYTPKQVKPDSGIFLEYAPFEKYVSKNNTELIKAEYGLIAPLISYFGKKDSKVLEYWLDNSLFSGWKKPPKRLIINENNIKHDLDDYIKQGFENISSFACFLGDDYEELYGEADISPFSHAFDQIIKE